MFKVILAGIVGVAAGVALAAWAETMDGGKDDIFESDDTTETKIEDDETLKDMATDNG